MESDNLSAISTSAPVKTPEILAAEIRALTGTVLSGVLEIGRRFVDAKELLPHGEFGEWVRTQTGYSVSTANNFMRLFNEYGQAQGSLFGTEANSQTIGNLSYSKALALLEVPAGEREDFAREVDAESISVRELKEAIREREEKLREAETAAEGYRKKLESNRQDWYEARQKMDLTLKERESELFMVQSKVDELTGQLTELRNAPRDVAIETVADQEAVRKAAEEARKAAERELREKIAKAERERDRAKRAQADAEQKLAAEKLERDTAEAAAKKAGEIAAEKLTQLQKKLAAADSPEKVSFAFWFRQGQECVNSMLECLDKLREAGRDEDAGKLRGALRTFLETALGALRSPGEAGRAE